MSKRPGRPHRACLSADAAVGDVGAVAGVTDIRKAILVTSCDASELTAPPASSDWCWVAPLTEVLAIDDGLDVVDPFAERAGSLGPRAVATQRRPLRGARVGYPEATAANAVHTPADVLADATETTALWESFHPSGHSSALGAWMLRDVGHRAAPGRLMVVRRAVTRLFGEIVSPAAFRADASTI